MNEKPPVRIITPAYRAAMAALGRKGGLKRSLKKADSCRRNASLPAKAGSLPRGEWGRVMARERLAMMEHAGLITAQEVAAKNPRISCEKSCGFSFLSSSQMLSLIDQGETVKWVCPSCSNKNSLRNVKISAKARGYTRKRA